MIQIANPIGLAEGPHALEGSSAIGNDPDVIEQTRKRTQRILIGFGLGIVTGLILTATHVAIAGCEILPYELIFNLIWAPCLGLILGRRLARSRQSGPWKWKRFQLRTRTLMVVIAYVALLLGMWVSTERLGRLARQYHQKSTSAESLAPIYRQIGRESEIDAKVRRTNVAELRDGKIPDGLLQIQREFLRSLDQDAKVTPEYRKYRRDLITEGEEQTRIRQENNADLLRRITEYHMHISTKYERARWRPWLPVEPDPPLPK